MYIQKLLLLQCTGHLNFCIYLTLLKMCGLNLKVKATCTNLRIEASTRRSLYMDFYKRERDLLLL